MKKIAIAVIAWSAIGAHAQAPTQAIVPSARRRVGRHLRRMTRTA
jgi:hypothetical protein